MVSFQEIKKNKNRASELKKRLEADNFGYPRDEKIWTPTLGDDGTGSALIRFLPEPDIEGENAPFVRRWSHYWKGPTGQFYNEMSLTTIGDGENDPMAKLNQAMWATENEDYRALVRQRARRLHYFANIYVIKDPINSDNEGKVFIYRFGKKIRDIISEALSPEEDSGQFPIDAFNLWGWPDGLKSSEREKWIEENGPPGANFRIRVRKQGDNFPNYDRSFFEEPSTLGGFDDDKLAEIHSQCHALQPYVDKSLFKSHDELVKSLERALGVPYEEAFPFPVNKVTAKKESPKSNQRKDDESTNEVKAATEDVDEELDLDSDFDEDKFDDILKELSED